MLSRYIIKEYPEFYPIFSQTDLRTTASTNSATAIRCSLIEGLGADGLKTGQVKESGYNLAGSAVQGGKRLIVVVHGAGD